MGHGNGHIFMGHSNKLRCFDTSLFGFNQPFNNWSKISAGIGKDMLNTPVQE